MRQIHRLCRVTLVTGILCLGPMLSTHVSAEDKNACSEDIAKFCKDVKAGNGPIMDCLEAHENELSDACRAHERKMGGGRIEIREEMRESIKLHQACKDDIAKLCKDMKPGPGAVAKCLKEHENELSTACSEKIKAAKEQRKEEEKKTE